MHTYRACVPAIDLGCMYKIMRQHQGFTCIELIMCFVYYVINMQLPLYTNIKSAVPEQGDIKRGFSLQTSTSPSNQRTVTIVIVIITVLLVLTGLIFTNNCIKQISSQMRQRPSHIKNAYFWTFTDVISMINGFELCMQFVLIVITASKPVGLELLLRVFSSGMSVLAMIVGMGCGQEKKLPPPLSQSKGCLCCCTLTNIRRYQRCTAMCNIYLLVSLICINIVPTAIYVFVNPILVLSTIASIVSLIFCFVVVLSLPYLFGHLLEDLKTKPENRKEFEKHCSLLPTYVPYILLCVTLTLSIFFYLIVLHKSSVTNTNDVVQAVASFLPSLIVGSLSYFSTMKRFTAEAKDKGLITDPLSDNDCLKMAEEGRTFAEKSDTEDETAHFLSANTKDTKL